MKERLDERLISAGLSAARLPGKLELFDKAKRAFESLGATSVQSARCLFVPGRIEVFGKHTDYAGGRSLLCAAELGVCLMAAPRADGLVRILDAGNQSRVSFRISADLMPKAGHWSNYPMTVARRIARNFPCDLRGADIAFCSDLPVAAGLSSSSALVIAFFTCIAEINLLEQHENYRLSIHALEDLAGYLGTVENGQSFGSLAGDRGVGTFGGSEDHTAILCCRPDKLSQYSFSPVRHERTVRMPECCTFVVCVSGVIAEKTGKARDKYNRAALSAITILQLWQKATGRNDVTLAAAISSSAHAPSLIRQVLSESSQNGFSSRELVDRFEQFLIESFHIIPAASEALASGRVEEVGDLSARSQEAAEQLLGNQVRETIWLARAARQMGAAAASAFGAGFGGSVWALVEARRAEQFRLRWAAGYSKRFPVAANRAEFFSTRAGPAMIKLW
jgi:galactokinase